MSSAANIKNSAARVAVKVPFPDSMVEVRMSPPESNFEVKVTPGGEVIELLIRPGCSQIEVRITQPAGKDEERPEDQPAPDSGPESPAGASPAGGGQAAPSGEPDANAEQEVLPGISRAEFAAMVEQDAADEAKKLLAEMELRHPYPGQAEPPQAEPPQAEPSAPRLGDGGAGPLPGVDYELPAEARKILEEATEPEESPKASATPAAEAETGSPPPPAAESGDSTRIAEAVARPEIWEPPAPEVQEVIEIEAVEVTPAEAEDAPEQARPADDSRTAPAENADAQLKAEKNAFRIELDYPAGLVMEGEPGDSATATIPEAVEEAARQALVRLSAATHEGRSYLELERFPSQPYAPAAEEAAPPAPSAPEQPVDRTIMVEYIEDTEAGPQHLPDDTATPLPEEDQMDLGPVETEDEELAIGPIDLGDLEFDLEKSRAADAEDSQTTVKARPMVTVMPNNTVVPQSKEPDE